MLGAVKRLVGAGKKREAPTSEELSCRNAAGGARAAQPARTPRALLSPNQRGGPFSPCYDSGALPFDDYAFAPGEDFQWYEDLALDNPGQYRPECLVHFTSDLNLAGILAHGPLSGPAGFGEGCYCVDERLLELETMPREAILQHMYCRLAYMDREPFDTGLLSRARCANSFVRLDTQRLLQDGRFGVLRIVNGQTNKMLTNYVIYKRLGSDRQGTVPRNLGASRSLNVVVGATKRSLVTPDLFALPSHGHHPDFVHADPATHVPAILQVTEDLLHAPAASKWHISRSGRAQAPAGSAFRALQDELHRVSMGLGTSWEFRPINLRGHERRAQYEKTQRP